MLLEAYAAFFGAFLTPFFFPKKHWTRYYVCFIAFSFVGMLVPILFMPFLISLRLGSWIYILICKVGSQCIGFNVESRGEEIIRNHKKGIVVLNHQSIIDTLCIMLHNRGLHDMVGVIKKEIMYVVPVGLYLLYVGYIFIDRNDRRGAMEKINKGLEKLVLQDKKLLIFPEGTRNQNRDGFLPFKKGAFKLAIKFKIPIIPTVLSPYYFIKPGREFSGGKIIISTLKPIETKHLKEEDVDDLMYRTRELMLAEYYRLKDEVEKDEKSN